MIYLINFNITYTITLLHVSTLMSHLQEYISRPIVYIVLQFLSNYCNKDPFLHYKIRVNVYMVLGRGVIGSCFPLFLIFGGGGGVGFHA
jgi:glycerol-3-phosphate acyltransferase PlsY